MTTFDVQFGERPVEPPNLKRRPLAEPPVVPIHENAIGSEIPYDDEPEVTIMGPLDFEPDPYAESLEDAFAIVPARWVDSQPHVKSDSPS